MCRIVSGIKETLSFFVSLVKILSVPIGPVILILYLIAVGLNWYPYGGFQFNNVMHAIAFTVGKLPDNLRAETRKTSTCIKPLSIKDVKNPILDELPSGYEPKMADCLLPGANGIGDCHPYLFEKCETIYLHDAVLRNPYVLGATMDAIAHPCKYMDQEHSKYYRFLYVNNAESNPSDNSDEGAWDRYNYNLCLEAHRLSWKTVLYFVDDRRSTVLRLATTSAPLPRGG